MSSAARRGFQYAGSGASVIGAQYDERGGSYTGTRTFAPGTRGIQPRGTAYTGGPTPGFQFAAAPWGGTYDGIPDRSVADLIDTDGFALVLENPSRSERMAFSPDQPTYRGIQTVSFTGEVNQMASWTATVPANPDLFDWFFSTVTIAYDGERRFHGVLTAVDEESLQDGEYSLSGYGPLYWAGHDEINVRYADISPRDALASLWRDIASATDGKVRGEVVRGRPEHERRHWIPPEGVSYSGTPLEVLKQLHGYCGYAFATDHSDPAGVFTTFVPGEELRSAAWQPTSIKPSTSVAGYHNQITVVGAKKQSAAEPITSDDRYSATVRAPEAEIGSVLDGEIHGRKVRNENLTSYDACKARALTILAEDRGEYTIGGNLATTPGVRDLVPGYTYRVPEFDKSAPEYFNPVWCSLRAVSQEYGHETATVSLSFDDESVLTEHIRHDLAPDSAPLSVKRRDSQANLADPNYEMPSDLVYGAGAGAAGSGFAGAVAARTVENI